MSLTDKKQIEGIEFLSEPSGYAMADEWYDFADANHFWMKWRFEALKKIMPKNYVWGEILDIGCGNGVVSEQIERHYGYKTCSCDLNLKALQMVSASRSPLYFYNIHERHTRFREAFSTVLLMDVLEHIDDPLRFLSSVDFHLSPEGSLVINVPAIQLLYSKYDRVAGHVKRYSIPSLKKELGAAGFRIERAAYWGMSLIPLLIARKLLLYFCTDNNAIKTGFQPASSLVESVLDFIRRLECKTFSMVPVGISLTAIAKRSGKER